MTTVALIQARLGSSRLPNKVLADIAGRPMIEHVYRRVKAAPGVDRVVLCLLVEDFDLIRVAAERDMELLATEGIAHNDALTQVAAPVVQMGLPLDTTLVRITGDCPLIDPMMIGDVVKWHHEYGDDYTDASEQAGGIDGLDVECLSVAALLNAYAAAKDPKDREHVTPWIRRCLVGRNAFGCFPRRASLPASVRHKWSVDTQEDLDFVREAYAELGDGLWGYPAVLDYLTRRAT